VVHEVFDFAACADLASLAIGHTRITSIIGDTSREGFSARGLWTLAAGSIVPKDCEDLADLGDCGFLDGLPDGLKTKQCKKVFPEQEITDIFIGEDQFPEQIKFEQCQVLIQKIVYGAKQASGTVPVRPAGPWYRLFHNASFLYKEDDEILTTVKQRGGRVKTVEGGAIDATVRVVIDVWPNSCDNSMNASSEGTFVVAIVGTGSFDISQVNTTRDESGEIPVRVEGVAPRKCETGLWAGLQCDVNDGVPDLRCFYDRKDVVDALGNDPLPLGLTPVELTGELLPSGDEGNPNGNPIKGFDDIDYF
jgi:hypothetical protein